MVPIVGFPTIVEHYAPFFKAVFSEEAYVQFKRYISGLLIAENKTISGINQLHISAVRSQSSLNRTLTRSPFSLEELHEARLRMLDSIPGTRIKAKKGVIGLDDTLLTHYGQQMEKIAKLWDHSNNGYVWSHNLVSLHYSDDQTDYPLKMQLWEPADLEKLEQGLPQAGVKLKASKAALKREAAPKWRQYLLGVWQRHQNKPEVAALYQSKLLIGQGLLQQWVTAHPELKLPVTFDNWYTKPAFCRFLNDQLQLPYVGTLSKTDEVLLRIGQKTLGDFADALKEEHLAAVKDNPKGGVFKKITFRYKGEQETYYSYCRTHHIAKFGKQRLVINYRQANLSDHPVFFISNRRRWQAKGITRFAAIAGPLKSFMKRAKLRAWTNINSGTLRASRAMLPLSPSFTAYCRPPNTTPLSEPYFDVNSRSSLRTAPLFGDGQPRLITYGTWPCLSVPACLKVSL